MVKLTARPSDMPFLEVFAAAIEAPESELKAAEGRLLFLLGALSAQALARGENQKDVVDALDRCCRLVEFMRSRNG